MKKRENNYLIEKLDDWIAFSKSIAKMYLLIIKHEQDKNYDEEYYNILALLDTAVKIEREKVDNLEIKQTNFQYIKNIIDSPDDFADQLADRKSNEIDILRRSNILDEILLYRYNNFQKDENEVYSLQDLINNVNSKNELQKLKFVEEFLNRMTHNVIAIIDYELRGNLNKKIRDYLIYLKYILISATPQYESVFLEHNKKTLPAINLANGFPIIEDFSTNDIIGCCKQGIQDPFLDDIKVLLSLNDFIIDEQLPLYYRTLCLNKARLISMQDDDFVNELEEQIKPFYRHSNFYSITNKCIKSMFSEAHDIIKSHNYTLKRND